MLISIVSNKGGVAKTTTAIHLAQYLTSLGTTTLVDADANESALDWSRQGKGFDFKVVKPKDLKTTDFVIIDAAARPTAKEVQEIERVSDLVIIPTMPDVLSLAATLRFLNTKPFTKYLVLITQTDPNMQDYNEARKVLEKYNHPVFNSRIRRYKAFRTAQKKGATVESLKNTSGGRNAWGDYVSVGEELVNEHRA